MPIFSAHYALTSKGTLIKNPLLRVRDDGTIAEFTSTGDTYKEIHSAQFFSGLLIPGFITELGLVDCELIGKGELGRLLNQLYFSGVQYIVIPAKVRSRIDSLEEYGLPYVIYSGSNSANQTVKTLNPWTEIVEQVNSGEMKGVVELLQKYLITPWQRVCEVSDGGKFEEGYKPGVFLVSGIDWASLTFNPNPQLKKLA